MSLFQVLGSLVQQFGRLFIWWYVVRAWDRAVRLRLGAHVKEYGPGLHLKIPYVDEYFPQTVRKRTTPLDNRTVTTQDGVVLSLGGTLTYTIFDVLLLHNTLYHAETTLQTETAETIAQYVATHLFDECEPEMIARAVTSVLRRRFVKYGLNNVRVRLDEYVRIPLTLRLITGGGADRVDGGVQDSLDTATPST